MLLKLAWRNIWRNRRRTFITMASIFFSVLFASLMLSWQQGVWDYMIDNVVNYYFGYAQVQTEKYWDEGSINDAFAPDSISNKLVSVEGVESVVPRLESFALASVGNKSGSAMVVGVDPNRENEMTGLADRVVKGEYFKNESRKALLGEGLADEMGLTVGDTIILISQGYHGTNAAGMYPVSGLVSFGSPELSKKMVYLPLGEAQYFYGAPGLVTNLTLRIHDRDILDEVVTMASQKLGDEFVVKDWKEMMPELVQARTIDTASNRLMLLLLYFIIAFGIFGTILMMTEERMYEFGIMVSVGFHRLPLFLSVWLEIVILGMLGAFAGIVLTYPIAWYLSIDPIQLPAEMAQAYEKFGMSAEMPTSTNVVLFLEQALIVFVITTVLALYPMYKILRLKPVKAMRS